MPRRITLIKCIAFIAASPFSTADSVEWLRATSLWWLLAHLQRHERAVIHMCLPHEFKGLLGAPVTHTKIRDIYFMAVITALPEKECDLGDCGSWPVLVWICLLLSAIIPFQWQCIECKLLMSCRQTGCGCLENITREMIKIQGTGGRMGLDSCIQGFLPLIRFGFARLDMKSFPSKERPL